jgi:hypothetical protein
LCRKSFVDFHNIDITKLQVGLAQDFANSGSGLKRNKNKINISKYDYQHINVFLFTPIPMIVGSTPAMPYPTYKRNE